jgi:thiamine pyrophosphokinase
MIHGANMKGLLFTGGKGPERRYIEKEINESHLIIAADSGFDLALRFGIIPNFIVGDMDSVVHVKEMWRLPQEKVVMFNHDKDETDTEIGLRMLAEKGCDTITIVGGGGGRLDHLLGLIILFERKLHPSQWYTEKEHISVVESSVTLRFMRGKKISFFSLCEEECTMQSRGLKWNLNNVRWKSGDAGISNEITENEAEVIMKTGRLLMIYSLAEE